MTPEQIERAHDFIEKMWAARDETPVSPVVFDAVITLAEKALAIESFGLVEAVKKLLEIGVGDTSLYGSGIFQLRMDARALPVLEALNAIQEAVK